MLSDEETLFYIQKAKQGEDKAKEVLLTHNTLLLKSIIKRYLNKGVEYDDLFQLASIGLIKAIKGFNEEFGVKFSTYAVPMIAGEIKRFLRDDGDIKVSRSLKQLAREMNKFIEEYSLKNNNSPSIKELATEFKIDESEVVFTLGSTKMPISIYEQSDYKDEKTKELLDRLPIVDNQEEILDKMGLKSALDSLDKRSRQIIILRYYRDMTQSQVAKAIGVSQVQVSRLENKIVDDIKKMMLG